MNENVEKLKDLKQDLERLEREHAEALSREPTIAHPVHEAANEAKRRLKMVGEQKV